MIITIDVGGTKISAALIKGTKVIKVRKVDSIIHQDLANLASYLVNLCEGWAEQAFTVAVACTGLVGAERVNFLSANDSLPLKQQLEIGFGLPVVMLNDAAAAAWAEYTLRLDRTDNTLAYITVSTGVGGGIVQNGKLVMADDGFCAHIGHMSVSRPDLPVIECHCGRFNCVEALSSGTAIANQASSILNKGVSCKTVFNEHLSHPEIALLLEQATDSIVELIANIRALTGTRVVVLGGSVGSTNLFQERIKTKLKALPKIYHVELLAPVSGEHADLIGAALYAGSVIGCD
ncbi:ROK family protein [Shewanella pealeana]|uniref:ROK family protein n=1 Tax=Shewanella pealeana (strain ATCC 700345 / ANG-SQ1) TaxID=398579 RepID=A8H2Q8_SHEPA|nr:ROK family protein [Shewanella pealeana]ABV86845.1 ROK family protein [Shewanella pealeana ATCC 700345]